MTVAQLVSWLLKQPQDLTVEIDGYQNFDLGRVGDTIVIDAWDPEDQDDEEI